MALNRQKKITIGVVLLAAVLLGRLFKIQLADDSYKLDAYNNSVVYKYIYPPRGIIYDRNGNILVGNKTCYDVMVTPKEVTGAFDTVALASALDTTVGFIKERFDYFRRYRTRIGYQSMPLVRQMDVKSYSRFAEELYKYPGFFGQPRSVRDYPVNACGNLLGYVSEVDAAYIKKHPEYRMGDLVGKTGIESVREEELRGEKGYHIFVRDFRNKIQSPYRDGRFDKPAKPGNDIMTTIDAPLQQYGQSLMEGRVGSVVALEPSTGEILAMISSPGIDADKLSDMGKHFAKFSSDPRKPLFNRAVQASYPPGSVFKLVNGLIGLQENVVTTESRFSCANGYRYTRDKILGCHSHRSPIDFEEGIMMSCNSYFCNVLKNIINNPSYGSVSEAFDVWNDYVGSFGFGHKLGSDFTGELGGTIPTSNLYGKMYGNGWKFETVVSLSIGQGEIGATPLQIANLAAIIANRGHYYIPHIIKSGRERIDTKVDSCHFEPVVEGMWRAVNSGWGSGGTATIAAVDGLDICGKTGTAENPHGDDHSVFICFAPRENPQIAVAVYVENAGFGATWACPIASLMVEKYLNGEIGRNRKWVEDRIMNGTD